MSRKVLLVDDTKTVLMFEQIILNSYQCDVRTAANGQEAIHAVQQEKPDLIFLDIEMPKLNGIETLQQLKNDPQTQDIPIIMVTTRGQKDMLNQAYEAGCNGYLTKPIQRQEMVHCVEKYLQDK